MTVTSRGRIDSLWVQSFHPFSFARKEKSRRSSSSMQFRPAAPPRRRVLSPLIILLLLLITISNAAKNDTNITIKTINTATAGTTSAPTFAVVDSLNQNRPPCDIRCRNGGTCYYISNDASQLEYESQAGRPIQRCHCPSGYGGVACEIPTEDCDLTTLTCRVSKRPCEPLPGFANSSSSSSTTGDGSHPMFTCACYVADTIGRDAAGATVGAFAGRACRKGYTEYCSSRYDPAAAKLYFCTNGGKCLADFLAARVAPGNTTANRDYEDAGCRCNSNFFYGPHCEFLKLDDDLSHLGTTGKKDSDNSDVVTTAAGDRDGGDDGAGSSYGTSSSESDNNGVSAVRSSGTQSDTVDSAEYRNQSAAFFAFLSFLGLMVVLTLYLVVRRNHLVRRSRRRRAQAMNNNAADGVVGAGASRRVVKVDGSCVWVNDNDDNSDYSEAQHIMGDQEAGIMGAAPVVVNGVGGYHGWNNNDDSDHDGRGLVQDVDQDDDHDADDEWNEDDDDEYSEKGDDFFDDLGPSAEHELVNQYNSTVAAAFEEEQPPNILINSSSSSNDEDQTITPSFSQESSTSDAADDLVSTNSSHTADITVPVSNTYYSSSSSRGELLSVSESASAPPGSRDDSASEEAQEQESDDDENPHHLLL
jgi:hypothetical protein